MFRSSPSQVAAVLAAHAPLMPPSAGCTVPTTPDTDDDRVTGGSHPYTCTHRQREIQGALGRAPGPAQAVQSPEATCEPKPAASCTREASRGPPSWPQCRRRLLAACSRKLQRRRACSRARACRPRCTLEAGHSGRTRRPTVMAVPCPWLPWRWTGVSGVHPHPTLYCASSYCTLHPQTADICHPYEDMMHRGSLATLGWLRRASPMRRVACLP